MKVGLFEFLVFLGYYIIAKALFQIINLETRRNGLLVPAAVSGLLG